MLIALAAVVIADRSGLLLVRRANDWREYHGAQATVLRILDETEIEVDLADRSSSRATTRVRLWGIAPVEDENWRNQASAMLAHLILDERVTLHLESHRHRDNDGRVLAHVVLSDGTNVNEHLLAEGLVTIDDRTPHRLMNRYEFLHRRAMQQGRGAWGESDV